MILGNVLITAALVNPFEEKNLGPSSYDLTLGDEWMIPCGVRKITLRDKPEYEYLQAPTFDLAPKEFVLTTTTERITLDNTVCAFVEGRSSIGRLGLFIHNAGFIDAGFRGQITLELYNASNQVISLEAGHRICQVIFLQVAGCNRGYAGKYQDQVGVVGSRKFLDKELG